MGKDVSSMRVDVSSLRMNKSSLKMDVYIWKNDVSSHRKDVSNEMIDTLRLINDVFSLGFGANKFKASGDLRRAVLLQANVLLRTNFGLPHGKRCSENVFISQQRY